jgi:hypothetical protein
MIAFVIVLGLVALYVIGRIEGSREAKPIKAARTMTFRAAKGAPKAGMPASGLLRGQETSPTIPARISLSERHFVSPENLAFQ